MLEAQVAKVRAFMHVVQNRGFVNSREAGCGDGRYETVGGLRAFGGDIVFLGAALKQNRERGWSLKPEQVSDMVIETIVHDLGRPFQFHSDEHTESRLRRESAGQIAEEVETLPLIGCADAAGKAHPQKSLHYDHDHEAMAAAILHLRARANDTFDQDVEMTVLKHDHTESGLFIVEGGQVTVRPKGRRSSYFVITPDLTFDAATRIAVGIGKRLVAKGVGGDRFINVDEFRENVVADQMITAQLLAEDSPIWIINAARKIPQVRSAGRILSLN